MSFRRCTAKRKHPVPNCTTFCHLSHHQHGFPFSAAPASAATRRLFVSVNCLFWTFHVSMVTLHVTLCICLIFSLNMVFGSVRILNGWRCLLSNLRTRVQSPELTWRKEKADFYKRYSDLHICAVAHMYTLIQAMDNCYKKFKYTFSKVIHVVCIPALQSF